MPVEYSEYKGNPIISCKLDANDKHPHTFGIGKAKRILANIDAIKDFVAKNSKAPETQE